MPDASWTQLQMMLVQQAGAGALPLSILPAASFIPFVRAAEQLCIDEALAPILVYWSRHSAAKLLPGGSRYRQLMKSAFCVSIFSEEKSDPPEAWCVLIESNSLSMIVFGQQALETTDSEKYQCSGSLDPQVVRQAFNRLLPTWQFIDLTESNRLEDARVNIGYCGSAPPLAQRLRAQWPVIKSPIQQSLILPVGSNAVTEFGKVSPIDLDAMRDAQAKPGNIPIIQGQGFLRGAISKSVSEPKGKITPDLGDGTPYGLDFSPSGEAIKASNAGEASDVSRGELAHVGSFGNLAGSEVVQGFDAGISKQRAERFPTAAQSIISEIIGRLRHSGDLSSILQFAIEKLTIACNAERGLIWQVVGDQLAVTNEFSQSGNTPFVGNLLPSEESTALVLEFLSRFPDESGAGVISIADTALDTNLHRMSPMLSSLIELGEVKARLMVQLRSRGIFSGWLELQQSSAARVLTRQDAVLLQSVAEMLSVVVQQTFDQSKIEMDAREMKLINEIASLFRESRGQTSQESLVKSVMLVADHMGFVHSQIYLYSQEDKLLLPQIQNDTSRTVELSMKDNPFVAVFESGRAKVINMIPNPRKGDSFFKHDMALVLPLVSEGERLGVVGLWQRQANKLLFRAQDRELGLTIAGHLSNVIRADQAISQIRADQARAALINKVSSEIRQSLKDVDQIMETLVESLREHFDLTLSVVSLYDSQRNDFSKSKTAVNAMAAPLIDLRNNSGEVLVPNIGEQLVFATLSELREGKTLFLTHEEMRERLSPSGIEVKPMFKAATLVPLVHAGNFKAALCMMQGVQERPLPKNDMMMVADLADRVAVVVSHAELFAQVERQAVTDPMTGLFNRRYFQEQLSREIDRFQRFGHAFSLVIVDLDYLKKINDSLGHNSGDVAIKHIANVLKCNVRDVDTVGRFGGEEFVVLLPETDIQHARMVSERICLAIREKPIEEIGTITASLGVATYPNDAQDREKLFELADQALFLAKHKGRNQVCSVSVDLAPTLSENRELVSNISIGPGSSPLEAAGAAFELNSAAETGLLGMVSGVTRAIDKRDLYYDDRSTRATVYADNISSALKLTKEHRDIIALAAAFSNLGKLNISEEILRKPGPLSREEKELMRRCPGNAANFLKPAKLLERVGPIVGAFKEHWDGSGYPNGLKGTEIPVEARIIALVDSFIAMTTDRPYRKKLSQDEAIDIIRENAGKEYDPSIVKIFLSVLRKENHVDDETAVKVGTATAGDGKS